MTNGDPLLDLPLSGLHLLEASAGTGKTTALTGLFLRGILEGIKVERILVVTFTESAAEEVRGRIHDILVSARRQAMGEPDKGTASPFLSLVRPDHARFLTRALFDFDRSTVTTIHAFCRRLLREYAFEFTAPFSLELEGNPGESRGPAFREIWRRRVYPEPPEVALLIASVFPGGPEDLGSLVSDAALFAESERVLSGSVPETDDFPIVRESYLRDLARVRRISSGRGEEVGRLWEAGVLPAKAGPGKKRKDPTGEREGAPLPLIRRLKELLEGGPALPPGLAPMDGELRSALYRLPPEIREEFSPLLRLLEGAGERDRSLRNSFRRDLLSYLRTEDLAEREGRGKETFDDMILRVLEGLLSDSSGALSAKIRTRFPLAFVDEFQDTDLAQFRIFDRIYCLSSPSSGGQGEGGALFLVGDPKQSIFRFRGADISAYLEARQRATSLPGASLIGLSVNYRSDRRHVEAVNRLFALVPDPFRTGGAILYEPVRPSHEGPSRFRDPLAEQGGEAVPILLEPGGEGERLDDFAKGCGREISRLLGGGPTIDGRPVRPEDIAVLVRQHSHGKKVQEALEDRGIPSVSYGSGSVLETDEAFDLEMLLLSLASPDDRRQARLVFASRFFGTTAAQLREIEESQELWNRRVDPFFRAALLWEKGGAMGTLRSFFLDQGIFSRLLAGRGGRRRITHLFHLFEFLEELGRDRPPLVLLVDRYLSARREAAGKKDDKNAPRLDTFEGRVRILTLHKAKGMEFPIVILPFGLSSQVEREDDAGLEEPGEEAEEMRLLYVALTRAVHRTVIMIPSLTSRQSALGHLFGLSPEVRKGKKAFADFREKVGSLLEGDPPLFAPVPEWESFPPMIPSIPASVPDLAPLKPLPPIPPPKRTESFSSLLRRSLEHPAPGEERGSLRAEDEGQEEPPGEETGEETLPAGPLFGSYFHRIMEHLGGEGENPSPLSGRISEGLPELCLGELGLNRDPAFASWPEAVCPLVERTLATDLGAGMEGGTNEDPMTLARVLCGERAVEREFLLPVRSLLASRLEKWLLPDGPRLSFDPVTGSLRGFVDLFFRYGGRYFLLDYKTNRLKAPPGSAPYAPDNLARTMAAHRYDLQGLIYILAIHRLLSFARPEYDYGRDFGGAIFLFVRGSGSPGDGICRIRPSREELDSFDALLSGRRP